MCPSPLPTAMLHTPGWGHRGGVVQEAPHAPSSLLLLTVRRKAGQLSADWAAFLKEPRPCWAGSPGWSYGHVPLPRVLLRRTGLLQFVSIISSCFLTKSFLCAVLAATPQGGAHGGRGLPSPWPAFLSHTHCTQAPTPARSLCCLGSRFGSFVSLLCLMWLMFCFCVFPLRFYQT